MRVWMVLVLLAGCAGEAAGTDPGPGGVGRYAASLGEDPDFSRPHGLFQVEAWEAIGEVGFTGVVADGPALELRTEASREGQCRLLTYSPSNCTPACEDDAICIDGACQAWPSRLDPGAVDWTFPGGAETVEPDALLAYQASGLVTEQGQHRLLGTDLDLTVATVAPVEAVGDWQQILMDRSGGDALLTWSNPSPGARIRLAMTDCTGTHGGIGEAEIECEGPDTGELRLPAAFLDALDAGDWSRGNCGEHVFRRYDADADPAAPELRFESLAVGSLWYRPDGF